MPCSSDPLDITRDGIPIPLSNLFDSGRLTQILWDHKKISFDAYLKARFSGGKLDFSHVDDKMVSSEIQPDEQSRFTDAFGKFEKLDWSQIHVDKGLDYKEYHGAIGPRYRHKKTYKFRVSEKFRCHGYREGDSFVVIGFETDHKSSDRG
ncbi:MAG: hypothetical protein BECKG1743D_GA0114223_100175 [Candidatus Kentron sp. G]|nr:MAG: hypothetical protein BECKG1743F_GA0114225_100195 [Candidatus Kentron sp. G]VFM95745.1 MAG: hypothetical protein BECKG1743E_GA0114224_100161 [Candidatus Kentron sp. G]VFM97532.1 MAG: hypothetical protein BECKG1743D_GA0114223_100175 [Candidatus Kentron sp. G]